MRATKSCQINRYSESGRDIPSPRSIQDIPFPACGWKIDIRKWWMMMVHPWVRTSNPRLDINSFYFLVQFLKYLSLSFFPRSAFLLVPLVLRVLWVLLVLANQNKWELMVDGRGSRTQGPARNLSRSSIPPPKSKLRFHYQIVDIYAAGWHHLIMMRHATCLGLQNSDFGVQLELGSGLRLVCFCTRTC